MSNIYSQEPPTYGKVLLKTTVGDIDVELWSKEAPKACRNFVQLCMEGYYDNTIFHRIMKGFIGQGGDPTGTGSGGDSIYDEPFKDEFHSRLRFVRRGLVAMASSEKDSNGSQFFFTFASTPELQNKHTIFGKVTGNTIYNMIKLEESEVDKNDRPFYPHKIISTEIILNPFEDIVPRIKKVEEKIQQIKVKSKGKKDFKLLSFGDEAEEEEEQVNEISKEFKGKSKSSHDLLKNDPKLSSTPAVDQIQLKRNDDNDDDEISNEEIKRLKKEGKKKRIKVEINEDEEEDTSKTTNEEDKLTQLKEEVANLKKEMLNEKKAKKTEKKEEKCFIKSEEIKPKTGDYATNLLPKGAERAKQTLDMMEQFKQKIILQKTKKDNAETKKDDSWLAHRLKSENDEEIVLAKDANIRNEEEWFDIYDPRNPINKRRREVGESKESNKALKSSRHR